MQHGPLRNAYLDALGIDRWVPRNAPAEVVPEPVVVRADSPVHAPAATVIQVPQARAPLAPPVPLEPGIGWDPLRERVAACTACDLCKTRTQTVFGV
jgi:DNA polymerase